MKRRSMLGSLRAGFITLVVAVTGGWAALLRFLTPAVSYDPPQAFTIGRPGDFPFNTPTLLSEEKVYVVRDRDRGFAAVSAVCTHLGCGVRWSPGERVFRCPCHGSAYSAEGKVLDGPAPRPLDWYQLTQTRDGQLRVDKTCRVPHTVRLKTEG